MTPIDYQSLDTIVEAISWRRLTVIRNAAYERAAEIAEVQANSFRGAALQCATAKENQREKIWIDKALIAEHIAEQIRSLITDLQKGESSLDVTP